MSLNHMEIYEDAKLGIETNFCLFNKKIVFFINFKLISENVIKPSDINEGRNEIQIDFYRPFAPRIDIKSTLFHISNLRK